MAIRALVLGAGWVARRVHIPRLLASASVGEVLVADADPIAAAAAAAIFGIRAVPAPGDDAGADLVVVCTPPATHATLARRALVAGCDVVVEKPLATTLADAEHLRRLAAGLGRRLHVCRANRYRPDVRLLTGLVRAGGLGAVHECSARWLRRAGIPRTPGTPGAGVVWDLGTHLADVAVGLLGRPPAGLVAAVGLPRTASWYGAGAPGAGADTSTSTTGFRATAFIEDGPAIHLEASWHCSTPLDRVEVDVVGSAARARLRTVFGMSPDREVLSGPAVEIEDAATGARQVLLAGQPRDFAEYDDQWAPVLDGSVEPEALDRSVWTVALCEAVGAAIRRGGPARIGGSGKEWA